MLEISVTKLHIFSFSTKETEQFPDPEHDWSPTYYNNPVRHTDRNYIEELTRCPFGVDIVEKMKKAKELFA